MTKRRLTAAQVERPTGIHAIVAGEYSVRPVLPELFKGDDWRGRRFSLWKGRAYLGLVIEHPCGEWCYQGVPNPALRLETLWRVALAVRDAEKIWLALEAKKKTPKWKKAMRAALTQLDKENRNGCETCPQCGAAKMPSDINDTRWFVCGTAVDIRSGLPETADAEPIEGDDCIRRQLAAMTAERDAAFLRTTAYLRELATANERVEKAEALQCTMRMDAERWMTQCKAAEADYAALLATTASLRAGIETRDLRIAELNRFLKEAEAERNKAQGELLKVFGVGGTFYELEAKLDRLRAGIDRAIAHANGRWCEWGSRALDVFAILCDATTPAAEAAKGEKP